MSQDYTYETILSASERVRWRVEDLIGGEKRLDFGRRFLTESLARVEPLRFLSDGAKRFLNQIRGHGYLYMFGLVEEFILPFVMDHTREVLHGESARTRAMLLGSGMTHPRVVGSLEALCPATDVLVGKVARAFC
jgi:hypothetical protein